MSILDLIIVSTSKDLASIQSAFLGVIEDHSQIHQQSNSTLFSSKYWNGVIETASANMMELYNASVGLLPNLTLAFSLEKSLLYEARLQLLKASVAFGLQTKSDVAYFENYYSPVLRYKAGLLELKTHASYWPREELDTLTVPYRELPDLPTL